MLEVGLPWKLDQVALGFLESNLKISKDGDPQSLTICLSAYCISEKRLPCSSLYPPLDSWGGTCNCNASHGLLCLAEKAQLPHQFLQFHLLQPHCGLPGLRPVLWYLYQFVNTWFHAGEPKSGFTAPVVVSQVLSKKWNLFSVLLATLLLNFPSIKLTSIIASSHHWLISSLPSRTPKSFSFFFALFFFLSVAELSTSICIQSFQLQDFNVSQGQDVVFVLGKLYEGFLAHFSNMSGFLCMVFLFSSAVTAPQNLASSTNLRMVHSFF